MRISFSWSRPRVSGTKTLDSESAFSTLAARAASLDDRVVAGVLGADLPEGDLQAVLHRVNACVHCQDGTINDLLAPFENCARLFDQRPHLGVLRAELREESRDIEAERDLLVLKGTVELAQLLVDLLHLGGALRELHLEFRAQRKRPGSPSSS